MKRVLVAPMDWGLGHATRCIPIIHELLHQQCHVILAGSGDSLTLLREAFPALEAVTITGYRTTYPFNSMLASMLWQLPRFIQTIRRERTELMQVVQEKQIDLIIADNRYGAAIGKIPSIIITHQLAIRMPRVWRWIQPLVNHVNRRLLNRFSACWVPDDPELRLSGALSHASLQIPVAYTGLLSRFERHADAATLYDIAVVLSGPEPQRTRFEQIIRAQMNNTSLRICLVRGVRDATPAHDERIINFLETGALNQLLEQASLVIARSGYSTIMDLARLGKKAALVPTPGQTEQEYLAQQLQARGIAGFQRQESFDLQRAWEQHTSFAGFQSVPADTRLRACIRDWIATDIKTV